MSPYPPSDVRYVAEPVEQIAAVKAATLDDVRQFHADFYGAGAAELALVGNFEPAEVKTQMIALLGGWKAAKPYARIASVHQARPAIDDRIDVADKENAVLVAGVSFPIRDDDPDYPALILGNFMTGGGFLNSRLATRIRQKEGLSYGTRSRLSASAWDQLGWFTGQAIYAPQNAEKLEAAFREEIEKMVKDGFTAEEVADAKSGWLQGRQVSRSQERELLGTVADRAFEGRTFAWDADLEAKIGALTPEQIHAAMRRAIDPAKLSVVQAGSFAKGGTQAGGPGTGPGGAGSAK
jgi:zinc protease